VGSITQWISTAASVSGMAGLSGIVIVRWVRRWMRRMQKVVETVEQRTEELTPGTAAGGGSSLRDDVTEILKRLLRQGDAIGVTQSQVRALADELRAHVRSVHAHRCDCDAHDKHDEHEGRAVETGRTRQQREQDGRRRGEQQDGGRGRPASPADGARRRGEQQDGRRQQQQPPVPGSRSPG